MRMLLRATITAVALFFCSGALAEPMKIFDGDVIDLPENVFFTEIKTGRSGPIYQFEWRFSGPKDQVEAENLRAGGFAGRGFDQGLKGYVEVVAQEHGPDAPADARLRHQSLCAAFKAKWGRGLRDFDDVRQLGYCGNIFGAVVILICKYEAKRTICGSGLNYFEMIRHERQVGEPTSPSDALIRRYFELKELDAEIEKQILELYRPVAAFDLVESMLLSIRPE